MAISIVTCCPPGSIFDDVDDSPLLAMDLIMIGVGFIGNISPDSISLLEAGHLKEMSEATRFILFSHTLHSVHYFYQM